MTVLCLLRVISRDHIDGTCLYDNVISILSLNALGLWLIMVIVYICQKNNCFLKKITQTKVWKHVDKLSYTLYLTHYPWMVGPTRIDVFIKTIPLQIILALVLTIILAEIVSLIADEIRKRLNIS